MGVNNVTGSKNITVFEVAFSNVSVFIVHLYFSLLMG